MSSTVRSGSDVPSGPGASGNPGRSAGPTVEVLVKEACGLCRDAVVVAGEICAEFGITLRVTDITGDRAMLEQFAEELPVLRIDGAVRDFWRIDAARLRRLLAERTG